MTSSNMRSDTTVEQRQRAAEEARAANIRQGLVPNARQDADMARWVRGEVSLDQLEAEAIARAKAKAAAQSGSSADAGGSSARVATGR